MFVLFAFVCFYFILCLDCSAASIKELSSGTVDDFLRRPLALCMTYDNCILPNVGFLYDAKRDEEAELREGGAVFASPIVVCLGSRLKRHCFSTHVVR